MATSLGGIYLQPGEWVAIPSFRRLENRGYQYSPQEFGYGTDEEDFLGELRSDDARLFVAYGVSDSLVLALHATVYADASFKKDPADPSLQPSRLEESGLGDVSAEMTWRFREETERHAEWFAFAAAQIPHDSGKDILGTSDFVIRPGVGVLRGFAWCTLSARGSLEYDAASGSEVDFGMWSVDAQRRISPTWWVGAGLEGQIGGGQNFDEVWQVTDVLWTPHSRVGLRLDSRLGLTSQTEGWTGEAGLVFRM